MCRRERRASRLRWAAIRRACALTLGTLCYAYGITTSGFGYGWGGMGAGVAYAACLV